MDMNIASSPSEMVSLFFSCKKLKDKDTFSKSDPFLRVYRLEAGTRQLLGETEVVKNNLNPDFETSFDVEYFFEKRQRFLAEVVDCDDAKTRKGDSLGTAEFTLGDVLGSQLNMKVVDVRLKKKPAGKLIVRVEQENDLEKFDLAFDVGFSNIPSTGLFSSKTRFFEIRKQRVSRNARSLLVRNDVGFESMQNKQYQLVFRSKQLQGDVLSFSLSGIKSAKLCDNDQNLPFQVVLMKYKKNGSHYALASKQLTLSQLTAGPVELAMDNAPKMQGKDAPRLAVRNLVRRESLEFTDYLKGGLSLTQFMGIDFTASNGFPHESGSLHRLSPGSLNQYQRAILSLGEILEKYNSSRIIPCYGFGAVLPGGQTSFDFPISLNFESPYLPNYGQVFECYKAVLAQIRFSGPTNFAPLLRAIIAFTQSSASVSVYNYTIFTIITDGAITDMDDTVAEIVRASSLPMSIIIIGRDRPDSRRRQRELLQNGHSGRRPAQTARRHGPRGRAGHRPVRALQSLPEQPVSAPGRGAQGDSAAGHPVLRVQGHQAAKRWVRT